MDNPLVFGFLRDTPDHGIRRLRVLAASSPSNTLSAVVDGLELAVAEYRMLELPVDTTKVLLDEIHHLRTQVRCGHDRESELETEANERTEFFRRRIAELEQRLAALDQCWDAMAEVSNAIDRVRAKYLEGFTSVQK